MLELQDEDGWEEPEEDGEEGEEARAPDPAVERAKPRIRQLFEPGIGPLLYQIQIAVMLEAEFFHWVTFRALRELVDEGRLVAERMPLGIVVNGQDVYVKFFRTRSHRNWRREAGEILGLIRSYSLGPMAEGIGKHGEMMFDAGLGGVGFRVLNRNVRDFGGVGWTRTNHNLDRAYERDGVRYGAEIKNTLAYISRREFLIKLEMCRQLRLRPLFIARSLPRSYAYELWRAGGFGLQFKYQFYPHGYHDAAQRVREALKLPVDCPARIADGTIARFERWHVRNLARNAGGYP